MNSHLINYTENSGTVTQAVSNNKKHFVFTSRFYDAFHSKTSNHLFPSHLLENCSVVEICSFFDFTPRMADEECGVRISEHHDSASVERQKGNVDLLPAERGPSRWACTQTTQNIKHSQLKSLAVTGDETLHRREAF